MTRRWHASSVETLLLTLEHSFESWQAWPRAVGSRGDRWFDRVRRSALPNRARDASTAAVSRGLAWWMPSEIVRSSTGARGGISRSLMSPSSLGCGRRLLSAVSIPTVSLLLFLSLASCLVVLATGDRGGVARLKWWRIHSSCCCFKSCSSLYLLLRMLSSDSFCRRMSLCATGDDGGVKSSWLFRLRRRAPGDTDDDDDAPVPAPTVVADAGAVDWVVLRGVSDSGSWRPLGTERPSRLESCKWSSSIFLSTRRRRSSRWDDLGGSAAATTRCWWCDCDCGCRCGPSLGDGLCGMCSAAPTRDVGPAIGDDEYPSGGGGGEPAVLGAAFSAREEDGSAPASSSSDWLLRRRLGDWVGWCGRVASARGGVDGADGTSGRVRWKRKCELLLLAVVPSDGGGAGDGVNAVIEWRLRRGLNPGAGDAAGGGGVALANAFVAVLSGFVRSARALHSIGDGAIPACRLRIVPWVCEAGRSLSFEACVGVGVVVASKRSSISVLPTSNRSPVRTTTASFWTRRVPFTVVPSTLWSTYTHTPCLWVHSSVPCSGAT